MLFEFSILKTTVELTTHTDTQKRFRKSRSDCLSFRLTNFTVGACETRLTGTRSGVAALAAVSSIQTGPRTTQVVRCKQKQLECKVKNLQDSEAVLTGIFVD